MSEFTIGDAVSVVTKDGATFTGRLEDFTEAYFLLRTIKGVLGFPHSMIAQMENA